MNQGPIKLYSARRPSRRRAIPAAAGDPSRSNHQKRRTTKGRSGRLCESTNLGSSAWATDLARGCAGFGGWCRSTLYDLPRCEPVGDLCHLYPHILADLRARDKDDEPLDLGDAFSSPTGVGDADVVLLPDLNWLLEGPRTPSESSPVAISSSLTETQ